MAAVAKLDMGTTVGIIYSESHQKLSQLTERYTIVTRDFDQITAQSSRSARELRVWEEPRYMAGVQSAEPCAAKFCCLPLNCCYKHA